MQPRNGVLSPHAELMPVLHPLYFLFLNWGYSITPTYHPPLYMYVYLIDMKTTSTHMKWGTYLY